eukprot:3610786-Pyramimonas_sp.AAC.1
MAWRSAGCFSGPLGPLSGPSWSDFGGLLHVAFFPCVFWGRQPPPIFLWIGAVWEASWAVLGASWRASGLSLL